MDRREMSGCNFDGGFNKLICEDDLQKEEHPSSTNFNYRLRQGKLSFTLFIQCKYMNWFDFWFLNIVARL